MSLGSPDGIGMSSGNAIERPVSKHGTSEVANVGGSPSLDVEAAFQQVGAFGRAQVCVVILVGLTWTVSAWGFSMPVFIAASPHRKVVSCTGVALADASSCEVGALLGEDAGCEDNSEDNNLVWAYDHPQETLAAEWELVCKRHVLVALVGSVYFFGVLLGNLLLGPLPDMIGRTRAFCLSLLISVPSSAVGAVAPSFSIYLVSRFFLGLGIASVCAVAWVAGAEAVGSSHKSRVIVAMSLSWAMGMLTLVPAVLVVPEWRALTWLHTMLLSLLLVVSLVAWKRGLESPPWLASRGEVARFHRVMSEMAYVNGTTYVAHNVANDAVGSTKISQFEEGKMSESKVSGCSQDQKESLEDVNFKAVFCRAPWGRYTVVFSLCFSALALGYYGLSLNSGHTEKDSSAYAVHIALLLSALGEFPGVLLSHMMMDSPRFGRRRTLFGGLFVASICCMSVALVPKDAVILSAALVTAGKTFNVIGYVTVYVYSAEVYPVLVRGLSLGFFSTASRVTAIMAPVLVELPPPLPAFCIGAGMAICAIPALILPETLPKPVGDAPTSESSSAGTAAKLRGRGLRRYAHLSEEGGDARECKVKSSGCHPTASQGAAPEVLGNQTLPSGNSKASEAT